MTRHIIENVLEEWFAEVSEILGEHTMSRTVDMKHLIFTISWNSSETRYRVQHYIPNSMLTRFTASHLKCRLASVTETIKRVVNKT